MAMIDRAALLALLERLDAAMAKPQQICVIGSCALLLLGHGTRSTEDIDVWAPDSRFDDATLEAACARAGLGFNPTDEDAAERGAYLQVVHPGVVALPAVTRGVWARVGTWATGEESTIAWSGRRLTVTIPPAAVLAASKLARCEDRDLSDCAYLMAAGLTDEAAVRAAARKMPRQAREAAVENVVLLMAFAAR